MKISFEISVAGSGSKTPQIQKYTLLLGSFSCCHYKLIFVVSGPTLIRLAAARLQLCLTIELPT